MFHPKPIRLNQRHRRRKMYSAMLEKIASLREKGILTDEEFERRKADLLSVFESNAI